MGDNLKKAKELYGKDGFNQNRFEFELDFHDNHEGYFNLNMLPDAKTSKLAEN